MKTVEFESTIAPNGQIDLPAELAAAVPPGMKVHVVVHWDGVIEDDASWLASSRLRFEAAYSPDDSIYEQLMNAPLTR